MSESTTPAVTPSSGWRSRRRLAIVAILVVVVVGGTVGGVIATSGSSKPVAATPSPTPSATPSPTPTPTPTPRRTTAARPPVALTNPFTGIGPVPKGPVIAVKIDDTANGRPQQGIDQADVVYVEQAEGGLTRLIGVFATHKPTVEAVRSTRASDPELLSQYGPITLVASGGGGDSLTILDHSVLHGVINDRGGPGFDRDGNREAPYNLQSNLAQVATAEAGAGGARSIGWTFAPATVDRAQLAASPFATGVTTTVGGTSVHFAYDAATSRFRREIDGTPQTAADGTPISTPNVIVQFCQVSVHPQDVDVEGNPSQYTHSIGSGTVAVFRNGREILGRWRRASIGSGTTLVDKYGHPIPLAPGGAWVVLATTGAPLTAH